MEQPGARERWLVYWIAGFQAISWNVCASLSGEEVQVELYVSVDLVGGRSVSGGYVQDEMNMRQQAEAIYKTIASLIPLIRWEKTDEQKVN